MFRKELAGFILVGLAGAVLAPPPAHAQKSEDLTPIQKQIDAIQKDVAEIKKILEEMRPKPPKPFEPMDISINGAPVRGQQSAKVTIIEFTDYQCPFCKRHADSVLPQLAKEYIEVGKARYFLRDFPLTAIHPRAAKASEAALCAGEQEKYWEMHGKLFQNQKKLGDADLLGYGKELALDEGAFKKCLDDKKYEKQVSAGLQEGTKAGITGTPSFLLGLSDPKDNSKIRATKILRGALPLEQFKKAIDELLTGGGEQKPPSGSQ